MEKYLREGVTTGTCATAAALASVLWQTKGHCPNQVAVDTPAGKSLKLEIISGPFPLCRVKKDAGDDPDVTDGCFVEASVEIGGQDGPVVFAGGDGIGTVTAEGLKVDVGEPAINPVPRQMIESHIRKVIGERAAKVTLSIPGGDVLTKKTFNPRLGIEGGLSILGTSGIVRPMSEEALKESLVAELCVRLAATPHIAFVPGNTGETALHSLYGDGIACVQISNYVGFMLDEALARGAETVLLAGFAGKLVKVAADIMMTHSHVADGRRETVCTYAALKGAPHSVIRQLFECKTIQKTIDVIRENNLEAIWDEIAEAAACKCCLRTGGEMMIAVLLLDKDGRILGQSSDLAAAVERLEGLKNA